MLSPLIVIGCGGSGVKTVRHLRKSAKKALSDVGWDGPLPQAWQFIGVDTGSQHFLEREPIPGDDYLCLNQDIPYRLLQTSLNAKHSKGTKGNAEMMGWIPDSRSIIPPTVQSAGQFRPYGRMAGLASLMPQLSHRLTKAYEAIESGAEEFHQITQLLTDTEFELDSSKLGPLVVVVGSMAGGTGSAIMFDIHEVVQRLNPTSPFLFNVVYSDDVFKSLVGTVGSGLRANSLAFMSELLAFSWNGLKSTTLIESGAEIGYVVPPLTFIVESTNLQGSVLASSPDESFQQIASWLTGLAISTESQMQLMWAMDRQYPKASMNRGEYGFGNYLEHAPPGAIYSLGHAKLSVGRDRFPEYANKLLQRETVDFLVNGQREISDQQLDNRLTASNKERVKQKAEGILQSFLAGASLSVSSELEAHFVNSVFSVFDINSLTEKLRSDLENEVNAVSGNRVDQETTFQNAVQQVRVHNLEHHASLISEKIREIKYRVLQEISHEVNNNFTTLSIPVVTEVLRITQQLIDQSAGRIRIKAADQLRNARLENDRALEIHELNQKRKFGLTRKADKGHLDVAANSIVLEVQSQILDYLAAALEVLAKTELENIVRQLDDAKTILQSMFDDMADWPKMDQDVPHSLRPRQFEFCLEGFESWPNSLRTIISEPHMAAEDSDNDFMQIARSSIVMGGYESRDGEWVKPLIQVLVEVPQEFDVSTKQSNAIVVLDIWSIETRVQDWLRRKGSSFDAFAQEGLRSYLDEFKVFGVAKSVDYENRLKRYSEVFNNALDAVQPLIQIDENLYNEIHGSSRRVKGFPNFQMPLFGHAANEVMERAMSKRFPELQLDSFHRYRSSSYRSSGVGFTSLLNFPVNPSVMKNFTETQASFAALSHSEFERDREFRWRRTRKLSEFIPLPTELRHAAMRGFAVGRMLGYITINTQDAIKISGKEREYAFPKFLMTKSAPNNLLPSLLESMPLCFADVPKLGQEAFGAYRELISLGLAVDNDCLKFIQTGERLRIPVDIGRAERMSADTSEERTKKMLDYLELNLTRYVQVGENFNAMAATDSISAEDNLTLELLDELMENYQIVFDSIINYKKNLNLHGV